VLGAVDGQLRAAIACLSSSLLVHSLRLGNLGRVARKIYVQNRLRRLDALEMASFVIANGQQVPVDLPSSLETFLLAQGLRPPNVVVEHNGEAVAPSEFKKRQLNAGDRLEIVKIVAGG